MHLLYRGAQLGLFGRQEQYSRSSITDALFVYLDGEPEEKSTARLDSKAAFWQCTKSNAVVRV